MSPNRLARHTLSFLLALSCFFAPAKVLADSWEGWYEERGQRVTFRASLNSARDPFLEGRTSEVVASRSAQSTRLNGQLVGERRGRYWVWTKRYLEVNQEAIQYAAVLSPDGQELSGWWNISNQAQGRFAMRREHSRP